MKLTERFLLFMILLLAGHLSHGQIYTDTIYLETNSFDSYVNSGASTTNYAGDSSLWVYYDYGSPTKNYYSYLKADYSQLPANSVLTKADLQLYAESVNSAANIDLQVARITTAWTEGGVTFATVPAATSVGAVVVPHAQLTSTGWHTTEVTPLAQLQIATPSVNYGFRYLLVNRSGATDKGIQYASTEDANVDHRPRMIVHYYLPQVDTVYFDTDGIDATVNSDSASVNFGQDDHMAVMYNYDSTYVNRLFLRADLSHIPQTKIVTHANLKLFADSVNIAATQNMIVYGVTSNWYEDSIVYSSMPTTTTSLSTSVNSALLDSTGWQTMAIKNLAQQAVWAGVKNYGWRISMSAESGTVNKGVIYCSSEHDSVDQRPYLVIEYQDPISVEGQVTHASSTSNDGAITVTVDGGCYSYTSYLWRKLTNGAYSTIESGTNISNSGVSGLSDGLYLFSVTDYRGATGYRWFFVGQEDSTTTVSFNNAGAAYIEDAWVVYYKSPADSLNNGNIATTVGCYTNSTYDGRTFVQYQVDWDPSLEFTSARQAFRNKGGCIQYANSDNDAWISRVTGFWEEDYVNWTIRPGVTTENSLYIPTTTTNGYEARNDTFNIVQLIPYWQEHPDESFGFELALNDYTQAAAASRDYSSSDYIGHNLMLTFTVKPIIETFYYDSLGTGDILVNAPAGELPYTYLIGYDTLPVLDSIWYAVKDSIPVDSVTFYQGRENTRNYLFSSLPNDHYFIGVYDNNGVLIYSGDTYLTPIIEVFDSTNLDVDGDTLKVAAGQSEAMATIFASLPIDESGGFEIEIVSLDDDLVVGLDNLDDPFPSYTRDFLYAYEITTSGKVYAMKGFEKIDSVNVSVGDKLKMETDDFGILTFYKNQEIFASDTLADTLVYDLKLQAHLKGADSKAMFKMLSKGTKKPKLKYSIEHVSCVDSEGSITLIVPGSTFFPSTANTYTIYDQGNNVVTSGSGAATVSLVPGIYSVYYTYNVGLVTYSFVQPFVIGFHVVWASLTNINEYTTPYHYTTPASSGSSGLGHSANQTDQLADHFIQYTHSNYLPYGTISYSIIRWENSSVESPFTVFIVHAGYPIISKFAFVLDENAALSGSFNPTVHPVRVDLASDGTVDVYDNNVLQTTFGSSVAGNLKVKVYESKNVMIVNPVVSFCYPQNAGFVAKTKPSTDASYFIIDDVLNFQYTGEYNQSDLIYELTDEAGNVISTSSYSIDVTGSAGVLKKNADNRYTLDMQSLPAGFYLLTITNVKGEKHYLRIKI